MRQASLLTFAALLAGVSLGSWAAEGGPGTDAAAMAPLSESSTVQVNEIRFAGNTVFDRAELRALVASYLGRSLTLEDIEDLRLRITRHYVDAGYITSGAIVPEQSVAGGSLEVRIIEGRLTDVAVSGARHVSTAYLRRELMRRAGSAIRVSDLQQNMQVLLQEGVLERVNAELAPGTELGESTLRLAVDEGPRYMLDFGVANDRPVSVGETGGRVAASVRNLFGTNDFLTVAVGVTPGYNNYSLSGQLPLPLADLGVFFSAGRSDGSVVEESFEDLDITSREISAEAGLSYRPVRSLSQQLQVALSVVRTRSTTYLLGEPFSFSSGVVDGRSVVSLLRQSLDWTYRGRDQVLAARSVLDLGVDAFDSTIHADGLPDSRFLVWKGQAQYVQRFWDGAGQALVRVDAQLASDSLLPPEKVAVGGGRTVRGYGENTLVRDEALVGSAEYRHKVASLRVPRLSRSADDGALALAVFVDAGRGGDKGESAASLWSIGGGLRWSPARDLQMQVYKGFPQLRDPSDRDTLQEQGIHFQLDYGIRF